MSGSPKKRRTGHEIPIRELSHLGSPRRVLSIQSSVVYGYVGNKVSVFALEVLGFEVDPIHSVQLSNHTGYAKFSGHRADGNELNDLVRGLSDNGLTAQYGDVVTGYMGTLSFLTEAAAFLKRMFESNPSINYVCDPVLGDHGKLYVPKEFVEIYRTQLIPYAKVVTPNQTEAEVLSEVKIHTVQDVEAACNWFHDKGVEVVIITSCDQLDRKNSLNSVLQTPGSTDPSSSSVGLEDGEDSGSGDFIDIFASVKTNDGVRWLGHTVVLRHKQYLSGTGDLTTALMLAHLHLGPAHNTSDLENDSASHSDLKEKGEKEKQGDLSDHDSVVRVKHALSSTLQTIQAIISRTLAISGRKELALVQSKRDIERPPRHGVTKIFPVKTVSVPHHEL